MGVGRAPRARVAGLLAAGLGEAGGVRQRSALRDAYPPRRTRGPWAESGGVAHSQGSTPRCARQDSPTAPQRPSSRPRTADVARPTYKKIQCHTAGPLVMSRLSAAAIWTPALPERCQRSSCLAGAADEADENAAEPPCQRMDSCRQPASSSLQELHGGCSRADGLPSHPASSPKRPGAAARAPVEVLPAVRRRCSSSVSRSRHHVVRRHHPASGGSGLWEVGTGQHAAAAPAAPRWRRPGARRRAAAMLKSRFRVFGTKEINQGCAPVRLQSGPDGAQP